MILVMQEGASEEQVQDVIDRMVDLGFTVHRSTGLVHTVLGGVGPEESVNPADFEEMAGVKECRRIISPYKLAGRQFRPAGSQVKVGNHLVGGGDLWICASVSHVTPAQIDKLAPALASAGVAALRVRTPLRAHDETLQAANRAAGVQGLSLGLEVSESAEIGLADWYADVLAVPGRSMWQRGLLEELGRLRKPVLLERSNAATMEELLMSADTILRGGNYSVILCESGIRTFVTAQNTMDLAFVPVAKKYSHLPVLVDPCAGTGRRGMAPAMARAAVAAGADGLLLDIHAGAEGTAPAQALLLGQLGPLLAQTNSLVLALKQSS